VKAEITGGSLTSTTASPPHTSTLTSAKNLARDLRALGAADDKS
jgi:hypothetical protein